MLAWAPQGHPYEPPALPPKRLLNNTDRRFIEERRKALSKFLDDVLASPIWGGAHEVMVFLNALRDRPNDR